LFFIFAYQLSAQRGTMGSLFSQFAGARHADRQRRDQLALLVHSHIRTGQSEAQRRTYNMDGTAPLQKLALLPDGDAGDKHHDLACVSSSRLLMAPSSWSSPPAAKGAARVAVSEDLKAALGVIAGGGPLTFSAVERVESRALWRSYRTECAILQASMNQLPPLRVQQTQQRRLLDAAFPVDDFLAVGETYMFCVVSAAALGDICAQGVEPWCRFTCTPRCPVGPGRVTLLCRVALGAVRRGKRDSRSRVPEGLIVPAEAITVGMRQAYPEYILFHDDPTSFRAVIGCSSTSSETG
jgi:hypothetical protein